MDECLENSRICLNGRCVNVGGSYRCECARGYTHSSDGTFCTDLDECRDGNVCHNGKCANTEGGFQCICHAGYVLSRDGTTCIGKTKGERVQGRQGDLERETEIEGGERERERERERGRESERRRERGGDGGLSTQRHSVIGRDICIFHSR